MEIAINAIFIASLVNAMLARLIHLLVRAE